MAILNPLFLTLTRQLPTGIDFASQSLWKRNDTICKLKLGTAVSILNSHLETWLKMAVCCHFHGHSMLPRLAMGLAHCPFACLLLWNNCGETMLSFRSTSLAQRRPSHILRTKWPQTGSKWPFLTPHPFWPLRAANGFNWGTKWAKVALWHA